MPSFCCTVPDVDTLLITQDSESVLFYAVAGLYNLSNDASFAQMAVRKPGVLAKLHSLAESAGMDGYWGTPTATADFCEPNYAHTRYIAEFLNALSSVPIALLGVVGEARMRRPAAITPLCAAPGPTIMAPSRPSYRHCCCWYLQLQCSQSRVAG